MNDDAPAAAPDPAQTTADHFPGERGRTVPRTAWWVLGLALVVLVAFLLARPDWFSRSSDSRVLDVPPDRHFTHSLADQGLTDGVWLTDDSPATGFTAALPVGSGPSSTRLWLRGTTQVPEHATVFLTVSTDGQQIARLQLPAGEHRLDAIVVVPETQVGDGRLRTQVRVDGALADGRCLADQTVGMQVHLDPDSMVEAALASPIGTVRDAVAGWGHELTVVPRGGGDQWRTAAAHLGLALTRSGHRVRYADAVPAGDRANTVVVGPAAELTAKDGWTRRDGTGDGLVLGSVHGSPVLALTTPDGRVAADYLTTAALATGDAGSADPHAVTVSGPAGDELELSALGADTGALRITESRRWRIDYALTDLAGGRLPRAVRTDFVLPASPDDLTWILNVELNGSLIESRRLDRDRSPAITLPAALQAVRNTLTLTVQRDRDLGGCEVRVTGYPIALAEDSALLLGPAPADGLLSIPATLGTGFGVWIPDAAGAVAPVLDALVPVLAALAPGATAPPIDWGGTPVADRPFVVVGGAPGIATPVTVDDDRLRAGGLDIPAARTSLVLQTARGPGAAAGLSIQTRGPAGELVLPRLDREATVVVTPAGAFVVARDGATAPVPAPAW